MSPACGANFTQQKQHLTQTLSLDTHEEIQVCIKKVAHR